MAAETLEWWPNMITHPAGHSNIPKHLVFCLHGKGSDGLSFMEQWVKTYDKLQGQDGPKNAAYRVTDYTNFYFPDAPFVDSNGGKMWFPMSDRSDPDQDCHEQHDYMDASVDRLMATIEHECLFRELPLECVFLLAFDQGLAVALAAFLVEGSGHFGGIIGWGAWMPFSSELHALGRPCRDGFACPHWITRARGVFHPARFGSLVHSWGLKSTPIEPPAFIGELDARARVTSFLIMHAFDDDVVPVWRGREACNFIHSMGCSVQYLEMAPGTTKHPESHGTHWISENEGMVALFGFIESLM